MPPEPTPDAAWGDAPITLAQATDFAARVPASAEEQQAIARTLAEFPTACQVRGVFFEGVSQIVARSRHTAAFADLMRDAGLPARTLPFKLYAHRDFYKLFF